MPYSKDPFNSLLRRLAKKGFYEVLLYVRDNENDSPYYNEILNYCLSKKIVRSRSQVTVIVNTLTDFDLLERTATDDRPVRTFYMLTSKGQRILAALEDLEEASIHGGDPP